MPRKMPETHLWFRQGDDRMEDKKLNAVIEKLMHACEHTLNEKCRAKCEVLF